VIHLGDALNLSCREEYDRFLATMSKARKVWFMAPGNHDGIYFGSSGNKREWETACDGGGGPFTKAEFVEAYLRDVLAGRSGAGLRHRGDPGAAEFARYFRGQARADWPYRGGRQSWLRRVAWRIDHKAPHRSFVLQELDAGRPGSRPTRYILLDSSNYKDSPELIPIPPHVNPGATGDLDDEQLERLGQWLAQDASDRPLTVFFAHHPFAALTARARDKLDDLRRKYGVLTYVSAHTHHGTYFVNGEDDAGWLELNVGSMVDWPIEFRSFQVLSQDAILYTKSHLFDFAEFWEDPNAPECKPAWQPQAGDPDYYVDYARSLTPSGTETQLQLLNSLLHSYRRLIREVPSSPDNQRWPATSGASSDAALQAFILKTASSAGDAAGFARRKTLLRELEKYDRERSLARAGPPAAPTAPDSAPVRDAATIQRDYRICQAVWASQDDEITVRRARREDLYIKYPSPPPATRKH
jgi:hypothetical protein